MEASLISTAVPLFRMEGVSKRYGGVRALEKAELSVTAGRIHAILGENGAGKSTLIKIMAGVVAPDEGHMTMEGSDVAFASPAVFGPTDEAAWLLYLDLHESYLEAA